jgi:cellobiose phosphorylase
MQGGDWNDGMNRLGREGRGESVWLAFFLYDVLRRYADVAERVGDAKNAAHWRGQADELRNNIERHAWDGDWYLRAFADGGERVGSKSSPECRIDAIPQAWAVLSGAAATNRAARAMEAAVEHLVDREGRLVRLFTPPFDTGSLDPGYIRGYAPGVRENGGQYTHAAVWLAMAFAARGDAAGAWDLFDLLNPVSHAVNPEAVARYRVEPYVVAADVYTAPGHHGRGGWTWYTGSAGWMYQLLVGTLLGLRIKADCLSFAPLFHPEWSEYRIHYRYRDTFYHCHVTRSGEGTGVRCVTVDNDDQPDRVVHLVDDGREHKVEVQVG